MKRPVVWSVTTQTVALVARSEARLQVMESVLVRFVGTNIGPWGRSWGFSGQLPNWPELMLALESCLETAPLLSRAGI